jgi:hypothetical protein
MVSVGARAVFSTSYTLPLTMAQHLARALLTALVRENLLAADVVASVRVWILYNFMFHVLANDLGLAARKDVAVLSPQMQRSFYQDSWLKPWTEIRSELANSWSKDPSLVQAAETYATTILRRAATAGLSLTFAGDLRSRLFLY